MKKCAVFVSLSLLSSIALAQEEKEQYPVTGLPSLMASWNEGEEDCASPKTNRTIEVHHFDPDTHVMRQSPCIDSEANLLYLLIGTQRSLLIDTGAATGEWGERTAFVVRYFLKDRDANQRPLLVVHTHGHEDHRAGDEAVTSLPGATVAPIESGPLRKFFGFVDWPRDIVQIDLGGRVVDVIAAPGHHEDHLVFYDRNTRLLFTGDFLLPGRLLVQDLDAYRASAQRVAEFVKSNPVSHVLGGHIELDADGNAYPSGVTLHRNERALPLTADDVRALPAALAGFNGFYSRYPNFIVVNPLHNLIALATGAIVAFGLLVWGVRRLWKRRRAR